MRDANIIRSILIDIEAGAYDALGGDDITPDIINRHLYLAIGAGLLDGHETDAGQWELHGLTWAGYELLELIRDDTRWASIMRVLNDTNCYNFAVIERLAMGMIE